MQKISFQDTTILKKPYIDFNGIEYEVQDGSYDGGTDLNASTFNTMQNNIETAINDVQTQLNNIIKNNNIRSFSSVETGQTYNLDSGKKFDDYKLIEIRTNKKSFIFTLESFISKPIEIEYFEDITSSLTKIVVEIEYVSNTSFKCNKCGYLAYGQSAIGDNPYSIQLVGII